MLRKVFFVLLAFALALSACVPSRASAPAAPITKTDGLNHTVSLEQPAQRIVSLAPSNTEILFAVGAGAQVVGRDEMSDYPPEAAALPTVGGWTGFSQEAIVALQPDLVLGMADFNTPELAASLEQLGLTVYYLPNPHTLEEVYANIEAVGELSGHASEAKTLVASLQERVARVDEKVSSLSDRPLVFVELDATEPAKPYTCGPGTFLDLLLQRAGGKNLGASLTGAWVQIGIEELLVANPDIILLADSNYGETPQKVAQRPGWNALQAVQQGKVYPLDDSLFVRTGPRLIDGLEALARLLHPDVFGE